MRSTFINLRLLIKILCVVNVFAKWKLTPFGIQTIPPLKVSVSTNFDRKSLPVSLNTNATTLTIATDKKNWTTEAHELLQTTTAVLNVYLDNDTTQEIPASVDDNRWIYSFLTMLPFVLLPITAFRIFHMIYYRVIPFCKTRCNREEIRSTTEDIEMNNSPPTVVEMNNLPPTIVEMNNLPSTNADSDSYSSCE